MCHSYAITQEKQICAQLRISNLELTYSKQAALALIIKSCMSESCVLISYILLADFLETIPQNGPAYICTYAFSVVGCLRVQYMHVRAHFFLKYCNTFGLSEVYSTLYFFRFISPVVLKNEEACQSV